MNMEQTQCSKTLAFKLQTPGNNSEESIWYSWFNFQDRLFKDLSKSRCKAHTKPSIKTTIFIMQINKTKIYLTR
jgi:hypothetical protein